MTSLSIPAKTGSPVPRRDSRLSQRFAFTLVELMVALGIISILIGLLLPAVQMARESARRMQCSDKIRQLALATQNFHSQHRMLPTNGGTALDSQIVDVNGVPVRPFTRDFALNQLIYWGVADKDRTPKDQTGPWCYGIMPHIELQAQYELHKGYSDAIGIFQCPSRPRGGAALPPIFDTYGDYQSGGHAMAKTDYVANGLLIRHRPEVRSYRDIRDGTSHTILYGEKAFDPTVQTSSSWYWDEPLYIGGSHGTVRSGLQILQDGVGIPFRENWGSQHPGQSHFAFADGHVATLSDSTDQKLLKTLLSPADQDNR